MYEFNARKHKTEIIYFFTYPYSVSKEKVLIGIQVKHKIDTSSKEVYMELIVFEKTDSTWSLTGHENL